MMLVRIRKTPIHLLQSGGPSLPLIVSVHEGAFRIGRAHFGILNGGCFYGFVTPGCGFFFMLFPVGPRRWRSALQRIR